MNQGTAWGLAAISIVVVSWILYRYVALKSWREWARAGIVQAFIIAFYAEMYGFPVTLYLLTRLFGLDVAGQFWDGNLWVYLTGVPAAMYLLSFRNINPHERKDTDYGYEHMALNSTGDRDDRLLRPDALHGTTSQTLGAPGAASA